MDNHGVAGDGVRGGRDIPADNPKTERKQGTRLTIFPIRSDPGVVTWAPGA